MNRGEFMMWAALIGNEEGPGFIKASFEGADSEA